MIAVDINVFPLDAGLLARGQYSEGPATGHLDTGFLGFPVYLTLNIPSLPRQRSLPSWGP
jgi:hypothetical protein